jgi:hypothetical protein
MSNQSGNAYGLTVLCPIQNGTSDPANDHCIAGQSFAACVRDRLQKWEVNEKSPMARVPNTYLCRFFVLNDVLYEGKPATYEQIKSKYLVFTANFHGELEPYLRGMWSAIANEILPIWKHCVGFQGVDNGSKFVDYIKRCQVTTTFYFNGSTDDSLAEQLKSLYLKQEFSRFAFENQGKNSKDLQQAFAQFAQRVLPADLSGPTWKPGQSKLA